ncbi:MAG: pyridoxamine 5'-phosphate oxidase [Chloroflexi bacterium]|nr:pyridoxamine 5'-phosphate oxidase [Chloroflexota bacterium]
MAEQSDPLASGTSDPRRVPLNEGDVDPDPLRQFARWFEAARVATKADPHTATVATATKDGRPSARLVLVRGVDERGFVFYSNYESRKARELAENPRAALVFYWAELSRQVRVTGTVAKVSHDESERYFLSRPRDSRLGAWSSRQSQVIASREHLDAQFAELAATYEGREIPLPSYWGGYRVTPEEIEFWQSRPNRLHDRLLYTRESSGGWTIRRLSP